MLPRCLQAGGAAAMGPQEVDERAAGLTANYMAALGKLLGELLPEGEVGGCGEVEWMFG